MNNLSSTKIDNLKIYYRDRTSDTGVLEHSFENDIFYKAILDFNPHITPVIIDLGAHIGTFSLLSHLKLPGANIYAFEPESGNFAILKKNVEENNISNITCKKLAVDSNPGSVTLYLDNQNWGHSTVFDFGNQFEEVESTTLEKVIQDNRLEIIDLLKSNCEGAEFNIFESLPSHELKKMGMLLILYHLDLNKNTRFSMYELLKKLIKNNFRFRIINKRDQRGWIIAKNNRYYPFLPRRNFYFKYLIQELLGYMYFFRCFLRK